MESSRGRWWLAGLIAGASGLATSYLVASLLSIAESPVVAVADVVVRLTPGPVARIAIDILGHADKPVLLLGILTILAVAFAGLGLLARRAWWAPAIGYGVLAAIGAIAVLSRNGAHLTDALPVAVGFVTWLVALSVLTEPLRHAADQPDPDAGSTSSRRGFLVGAAAMAGVAAVLGVVGRIVGSGRRKVEETRRLLRLEEVTEPRVPTATRIGVDGVAPWMTPAEDFYLIDTAIVRPAIEPREWTLRIHGMVDREVTLTYENLVARQFTQSWITLNCVSNPVGGDLIGNAWWSGIRVASLLAEAGVDPDADAVLQTSADDWSCGTPLSALTDDRNAMLAVAMNGRPLPIDHGFPVRTIVPGLYGYVSACKWVVDWEVTKFSEISAYWTERGWGELGPVKMSSRVDVPGSGDEVAAGIVTFAGVAWSQQTGIAGVELAVDGGEWQPALLADVPNEDTWVQWRADVLVEEEGTHLVRVRATDKEGLVQTSVVRDVLPDGATGLHTVEFSVA
ncbi:MAG: molybdopterin-dependent oxidoreductase [Actinomycetota bacterium]|nr:molybdopterin-dependent oxidoreductase [Actinomycetota bacterium]